MRSIGRLTARIILLVFVLVGIVMVYPGNSGALASTNLAKIQVKPGVSADSANTSKSSHSSFPPSPNAHIAAYADSGPCSPPCGSGYLRYYGGKVQLQPAAYLVFWGSFWKNSSGKLNKDGQVVQKYFSDVSGTSFTSILTQYYQQNSNGSQTYISNTEQFDSTHIWIDTSKITPTDSTCGSGNNTIEDATIQAEVNKAITTKKWPKNLNTTYFVYTPPNYLINAADIHIGCSNKNQPHAYCGYHHSVVAPAAYAELVYPVPGCTVPKMPNKDLNGDSLTSITSHEQFEAVTDPLGAGWLDSLGYEIGDKCNATFSNNYTKLNNGGIFEIQEEFSDATGTCTNTFTPHLTVNTTADYSPPCAILAYSLRCAINQVNTDGVVRPIWFNISSSDSGCQLQTIQGQNVYVCTITPTSGLPSLTTSNISINGYTQPGAHGNTLPIGSGDNAILTIRIDGSNGVGGLVLSCNATLDHILGLEITNFNPYGILLFPNTVQNNTISGNFIGTDGTNALGNGAGIYIASGASFNTVGLTTPIGANLISGNSGQGVVIGAGSGNVIQGNYIGTDSSGHAALHKNKGRHIPPPLRNYGIANSTGISLFAGASGNQIGGILAASTNIVSYNIDGITSEGGSNTAILNNTISYNFIGVKADSGETGDTIDQNIITGNTDAGVLVGNSSTDSTHVAIQANSMYANGGLGIDLYPADTVNCSGPTSGAPNDYTPCPIIQTATPTQISGTACTGCLVEVYIATNESDDQGHGEGQTFVGSVTADSSGNWSLSVSLSSGTQITATATTPSSPGPVETSEFAANVIASNNTGGRLWVTGHDADYHCANEGNQCNYLMVAVNFVTNGSTLPVLALDHGTQVAIAISNAFGGGGPTVVTIDPRSQFAGLPLVDSNGKPLYSAIVVASDTTCGGCDNNNGFGDTPDSDAINARATDIQTFFNAGGGILALAGAENISVFYNFLPIQAIGATTTSPYTLTSLGLSLGLIEGQDDNCCATHNSFNLPSNQFQVAEVDTAGLAETMIVQNGTSMQWKRPARSNQRPHVPHNTVK